MFLSESGNWEFFPVEKHVKIVLEKRTSLYVAKLRNSLSRVYIWMQMRMQHAKTKQLFNVDVLPRRGKEHLAVR